MSFYLDSSALIQLYFPENHSVAISDYVGERAIPFCLLHELEARNGLELKVFRGEAPQDAVDQTIRHMEVDLRAGTLFRPEVDWKSTMARACRLSTERTSKLGCRSLDIMHIAVALEMGAEEFVSFDNRQNELAAAVKLTLPRLS